MLILLGQLEVTGWTSILGTLLGGGAIGGGVTALTNYLLNRRKQADGQELAVAAQSIEQYAGLVGRLEARIAKVETDHQKCMDEHIAAARQLGQLEGRITELRDQVKDNAAAVASVKSA